MTSAQIRQSFLDFFREKQHTLVPSSSLLPDSPNLLFTNAGMNQFVPIFLGERKADVDTWSGAVKGAPTRAADTQKCIRAGGKHNDLDDVGLDTYHHTFFEMLGNWSFGDYFKKEAIEWAWELIVGRWKFPANRLYATVYCPDKNAGDPSEFDQAAHDFWAEKFVAAGLDPAVHIVNGNKKDNFWMMGDTGPCGPCSELHVDLTPHGDTGGALVNQGRPECIEIWNLVFIQFNAQPVVGRVLRPTADTSGKMPSLAGGTPTLPSIEFVPLAAQHVDTGMGFERVTSIIQGTKNFTDFAHAKISNYETDIFRPIFDELERMSGKTYRSTLPGSATVPVASAGVSPAKSPTETAVQNAPQSERDARTPRDSNSRNTDEGKALYYKRRLPHFERPWAKYMVSFATRERRQLAPADRDLVLESLLFGHQQHRYELYAACVMPDHVHFLFEPQIKEQDAAGQPVFWPLPEILHSIKSFTAHEINKLDRQTGQVWENESFDRMIRGDADLEEKFHYVCRNPWDANVVSAAENYPWVWTPEVERAPMRGAGSGSATVPVASAGVSPAESAAASAKTAARDAQQSDRDGRTPQQIDIAFRVIADHIRTLSFAIADGIQPGNTDRNYVLRRILRRAVRYGRTLGFHEPFFYKLVAVLARTMGDVFPEIRVKQKHIEETLRREEEAFNKTLDKGIVMFEIVSVGAVSSAFYGTPSIQRWTIRSEHGEQTVGVMGAEPTVVTVEKDNTLLFRALFGKCPVVSGEGAFQLYDTYGFPLDLTELMARERGLTVDTDGFEKLMEEQRARARAAQKKQVIELSQIETKEPTHFLGYDHNHTGADVQEVVALKDKIAVVLNNSVCYAEMGGQVGDTGELTGHGGRLWRITNTQKSGHTWLHFLEDEGERDRLGRSGEHLCGHAGGAAARARGGGPRSPCRASM